MGVEGVLLEVCAGASKSIDEGNEEDETALYRIVRHAKSSR